MARVRRLFWLSAFAGIVYVLWRWRGQQAEAELPPAFPPPPSPSAAPQPEQPHLGGHAAAPGAAGTTGGPRRIPTRVHRGTPPAEQAAEPGPIGASPVEISPVQPGQGVDLAPLVSSETEAIADLAPLVSANAEADAAAPELPGDGVDLATLVSPDAAGTPVDLAPLVSEEAAATTASFTGGLTNVNTADHDALVALPGIGPALASRIIAYREEHGPFQSVDQLVAVQGIGERNLDEFRPLITV